MKIYFLYSILFLFLFSCQKSEKISPTHKGMYFSLNDYINQLVTAIDTTALSEKTVNDEKMSFTNLKTKTEILELKDGDINKNDWQGLYTIDTLEMNAQLYKIIYHTKKKKQRIQEQILYVNKSTNEIVLVYTHFNFSNFLYSLHKSYFISTEKIILETRQHNILGDDTHLKIEYAHFLAPTRD